MRFAVALMVAITLLVSAATAIAIVMSTHDSGPRMIHTVSRRDLVVTVVEQGMLESSVNTEIKSRVRGWNTVTWVVDSGTVVEKGDLLLTMDTLFVEEQIDERTKYANWSRSSAERSAAVVERSKLAVREFEKGRYITQVMAKQTEVSVAQSKLNSARNMLRHAREKVASGYASELEIEEKQFAVEQAELNVKLKHTELDVLKRFTHAEQLQTLKGNLVATKAKHEANAERAMADASRRDRALAELPHCKVRAPRAGLVIHPNAAKWESGPIAQGTSIHKDKVLLLMPDLTKMQVKVAVHESMVDRIKVGHPANVTLPDQTLKGSVSEISSVTRPAGWWTGNEVRYDTIVKLPSVPGLKPGMSAEVEIVIAEHSDVLTVPVAAIVETEEGAFCWKKLPDGGMEKQQLELGDSNDVHTIVLKGINEGDQVILNPPRLAKNQTPVEPKVTEKE